MYCVKLTRRQSQADMHRAHTGIAAEAHYNRSQELNGTTRHADPIRHARREERPHTARMLDDLKDYLCRYRLQRFKLEIQKQKEMIREEECGGGLGGIERLYYHHYESSHLSFIRPFE